VVRVGSCTRHADYEPCWLTAEEGLCGREERVEEQHCDLVHGEDLLGAGFGADENTVGGGIRLGGVLDDGSRGDGGWCLGQL
jgi:hypothetical protein